MTALHRFCADHGAGKSLCGVAVAVAEIVAEEDAEAVAETMPWCVVCSDLNEQACSDACLGGRREATR